MSAPGVLAPSAAVPLAPLTTLGVGGAAAWFVRATTVDDVRAAHRWCAERDLPLFTLGGGSNLVIADEGFRGLVLQVALTGATFTDDNETTVVRARAGEPWDAVVAAAVERGLAGIECLSGIPGSVGGTPIQNVGAYGQEVADVIESVTAFDRASAAVVSIANGECGFSYRMSRFKREDDGRFVVCEVALRLRPGASMPTYPDLLRHLDAQGIDMPTVADVRRAVLAVRRSKGMVLDPADGDTRSVGSFFMNPVVSDAARERVSAAAGQRVPGFVTDEGQVKIPAAWLIERAGFSKGHADGAVGLSSKHPLAIVNRGGAGARDVLRLAARIKRQVVDRFGVWLRPEPIFVGFTADSEVDYLHKAGD